MLGDNGRRMSHRGQIRGAQTYLQQTTGLCRSGIHVLAVKQAFPEGRFLPDRAYKML